MYNVLFVNLSNKAPLAFIREFQYRIEDINQIVIPYLEKTEGTQARQKLNNKIKEELMQAPVVAAHSAPQIQQKRVRSYNSNSVTPLGNQTSLDRKVRE